MMRTQATLPTRSRLLVRARRGVLWTFRESDVEQRCARFARLPKPQRWSERP
jgi:hypothetical protein